MQLAATNDLAKRCPQCRRGSLVFTKHYPVLTITIALRKTDAFTNGMDRLRYERAWVCQNPSCDYQELMEEQGCQPWQDKQSQHKRHQ